MLLLNLDHVALAVRDLDEALDRFARLYGVTAASREVVASEGVEEAMILVGGSQVQLLAPLSPDSPVARFLERRGEGIHHLAFAVPDLDAALAHLAAEGAELVDAEPRRGGGGSRIAFVHPRTFGGTLTELVEST
ncbi:MAG: methylmalonyl-CoA epimerase [Acidimicrobiia bacterium]|nr:methylmalonyl-CoA epimerase [Acidimicrobiia bacterium]